MSRDVSAFSHVASALRMLGLCCAALVMVITPAHAVDFGSGFKTRSVAVDGATLSVTVGGSGPPVLLLHGCAESSRMWKALANVLAPNYTVIAPDLPGIGDSSIPKTGLDMKTSAERVHTAVTSLGYAKVRVVGHDIGLMVAYAYAVMYPQEVEKLALMDAFLPGVAIPVLSIGGSKSLGVALGEQVKLISPNAKVVVLENAGHWIIEERPSETIAALVDFLR
jgi:pimeloyl-ACP methyl ester carboxylesterase